MSIAILSIPLGIISIILFGYAVNKMGNKPSTGKKKDDDTAMVEIIVSVVLFFVALGIFDSKLSTGGLFNFDSPTEQSKSAQRVESAEKKSDAQRELEEYNKAAVEKARSNSNENKNSNLKDSPQTTKLDKESQQKNLEEQRKAYQKWKLQIDARILSIDTTWSALWIDTATDFDKLIRALEHEKSQLEEIKIPEELSSIHKQKLNDAANRYSQWIDSNLKACEMKISKVNQNEIIAEVSRGDGYKIRSNVEISAVGRELGISD